MKIKDALSKENLLLGAAGLLAIAVKDYVDQKKQEDTITKEVEKEIKYVIVKYGDTLSQIAQEYNTSYQLSTSHCPGVRCISFCRIASALQ